MTATVIPLEGLAAGDGGTSFTVNLGGDTFRIVIRYNGRENRYYLSLFDEDDDPIVESVKLVMETLLLARVSDVRRPKGELIVSDLGGGEASLGKLGDSVQLVFIPYTDFIS